MDQDEILERIRKRREELEQEQAQNQVVTFETNEETGEAAPVVNFDNMSWQDQTALIIKAKANGYTNDSYKLATEQADRAEQSLLDGASRETLTDFYKVYTDESNRAVQNDDIVSYYKNEILKSRIKNRLSETATPFTALQDVGSEIGTNVMGSIADTINAGAMAYINATDNLDANILYDLARRDSGTLQNTLDNYGFGKDNYERLEKLRQQYPTGEAHDIIETLYNTVTKQNFNGDKSYFDTTVQYLNNLTNKDRFQKFERAHTLDETESRENLKLRESMSYNDLGRFALDTVGTISYMAPSLALGMSTAGALGGGVTTAAGKQVLSEQAGKEIAKQVGLTTMGLSAGGQAANTALRQGYEWNQAINKGLADGLLEYVSEVVGGEALNKLLVGTRTAVTPLGQLIGKGVDKIKNKWVRLGVGILGDISAEAWEEMATEAISPLLDEAILGKKITDWEQYGQDIFNAGAQSIIPTLVLGGMNRIQVANVIKSEMESITAAVELNEYISQEQKDKLLEGIVEAYDNASHFLSDEKSEEQYNQVVKDTFDALKEAEKKYKSAQELSRLITAGANVELQQRAPEANIIPRLEQTRQAGETVNRLNEAQQGIQNIVGEQSVRTNLGQALNQSTASQQSQEQQPTEEIEEGKTYNVTLDGKPATITIRSIRPDPETGELMAIVETTLDGKKLSEAAGPAILPVTDLEKRIAELQVNDTGYTYKINDKIISEAKKIIDSHYKRGTSKADALIEIESLIGRENGLYDEDGYYVEEKNLEKDARKLYDSIVEGKIVPEKPPKRKSLRKSSVDKSQKAENVEKGEHNKRKNKKGTRGVEQLEKVEQADNEQEEIKSQDTDYQHDLFEAILEQLDENEINKEAIKLWEEETGEDWGMDGWDYVSDDSDIMEKAREIVYERFANSKEGQRFIEEFEKNYKQKNTDQKLSTDIETSKNSIVERKIREIEANPKLREEHELTSLTEIRNLTRELLNGRLGVGQFRHKAYGVYNTLSNWVRLREISNVDTLMHETGHFIDDEILPKMYNNNPAMKQELEKLCEAAFGKHYNKNKRRKLSEGFAEATRYFMVDPQGLVKIAPVTAAMIEQEFSGSEVLKKFYPKIQKMFHDYINMTAQERVHSKVVTGTPSSKVTIDSKPTQVLRGIVKQLFNKYEGATQFDKRNEKLYKEKFKGKSLPTTLKFFDNLRRSNSSGESIKQQLSNGVIDPMDGKRVTRGLSRILEPLKEETKKNHKQAGMSYDKYLNNRLNDMIDLGLAERTIELSERSKKEGKVYETGIRLNDAEAIVEQFKDDKVLHDVLKEIRKVGTDLIDYAVKKGVLKPKAAEEIKKLNMFYMPLNRILDDYGSFGSSTQKGATGTAFKRLKGSDRDIQNPLESLVGNWARVLKTIDDNFIRQRLVEVAHTVGDYGDYFTEVAPLSRYQGQVPLRAFDETLGLILSPAEYARLFPFLDETYNLFVPETADPTKLTLSYLDNGVRKYLKFANNDYGRPLYDILTSLNANQANQLLNTISRFNQGIRLGATALNPFFAIGNTLSDQFQAFLYSDGLIIPVVNAVFDAVRLVKARALQNVDKASHSDKRLAQLYREYKESGASLSGKYKLAEEEVMKTLPDIWGVSNKALFGSDSKLNKAKDIVHNFGKILAYLPEFSEEMTRFGEFVRVYDKLVKDGMKPSQAKLEAGIKAKELTQDFSIQGETMQYVNKIIPFSAAKVGGLYRFGQELKNHPGRLSFRMGTLIALAMMVAQLRHGDDDAEAYYEELNNRKKFDNFVLPWGGSEPVILKKPQGAPRYFINLVEAIYDLATGYVPKGEEKKRLQDWLELAVSDILPVNSPTDMIPGFAQPLLENVINQDLYYGSKIVPQNLEKLDPKSQYNEYTSRIGRALGSIINYSPMKIDNFIEGTFAGMGSAALSAGDWIYDLITGESSTPEARFSATYLGSRFKADVYRSSESVNIVYDKIEEYEREEAEGRITPEQKEELENLKTAKAIFTKISKEMKQTRADSSLDSKEKGDKINELYELRTDAARYYLGKKLLNENNADKIDLYKYYPASSTYKYKVGGKTVDVSFEDDKIQEEYATMLRTQYEKELERLKKKNEYKRASDEDKLTKEKNLLTRVRNEVNDTMKAKVYRSQRGE